MRVRRVDATSAPFRSPPLDRDQAVGVAAQHVLALDATAVLVLSRIDDPVHGGGAECERAAVRMPVHAICRTEAHREERLLLEGPLRLPQPLRANR